MERFIAWVERNPVLAGVLGAGGIVVLFWLFFGGSSSSSSSSSNDLAGAYYAAEAAQTTAGTQLQIATEADNAATAQDQIQANAAEAIATTDANLSGQLGQQSLEATYSNNTTALGTTYSNNFYNWLAQQNALGANFPNGFVAVTTPGGATLRGPGG